MLSATYATSAMNPHLNSVYNICKEFQLVNKSRHKVNLLIYMYLDVCILRGICAQPDTLVLHVQLVPNPITSLVTHLKRALNQPLDYYIP